MPDFSSFFKRHELTELEEEAKSGAPYPNPSLSGWDEEGLFDLDTSLPTEPPPVVSSTPNSENPVKKSELYEPEEKVGKEEKEKLPVLEVEVLDDEEVITLGADNEITFTKFFGNKEPAPTLRPQENLRRDLLYAAQIYVNSYKDGNPISISTLASMIGKKEKELEGIFKGEKWVHFFKEFGLDPPGNYVPHLTSRQLNTLQRITNPLDARKLNTILVEIGVKNSEWRIWMRQPEFKDTYNKWMKDGMKDVQGEVARQVTTKATQGDPRAIETYLKLNGVNLQQTSTDLLIPFLMRELQQLLPKEQLYSFTERLKELTGGSSITD